jgi:class I fructose-bisphosphate aldolase
VQAITQARTVDKVTIDDMNLSQGKRARLYRLLYLHGPANGTLMPLPVDQGLEHGPRDFFDNPDSIHPEYEIKVAIDGGFSAIVFQIGIAERYMYKYTGKLPLILKLNGKTEIPSDGAALSPCVASVEDAVRIGADAVGYTLYVGSPCQVQDFVQFREVRSEAERYGMPVVVWSYPRGDAIEGKGGRDSLYAIDYAARVASELGADVVKVNVPTRDPQSDKMSPKPYNELDIDESEATRMVVRSAGNSLVLFSGGSKVSDEALIAKARVAMESGATGLIFGRNVWQRPYAEAMRISRALGDLMSEYPAHLL